MKEDAELRMDNVSTYKGLADAIHGFSKRLAKQSLDMDEQVKNFNMIARQKDEIVASTIEGFVNAVLRTREKVLHAREEQREKELLDELMDTARSYHEKYPDADYFDFAGLVAGMRRGSNSQEQDDPPNIIAHPNGAVEIIVDKEEE